MPTLPITIDTVPSPVPTTADPTNFAARADNLMEWFEVGPAQIQQVAETTYDNAVEAAGKATEAGDAQAAAEAAKDAALGATDRIVESASSHSLTVGAKTFVVVGAGFSVDEVVCIIRKGNNSQRMWGLTQAGTNATTVNVDIASTDDIVGSGGPYTDWVIVSGIFVSEGATAAEARAGTSKHVALSPGVMTEANAPVALVHSATVTPDMADGKHRSITAPTSFTFNPPTNAAPRDIFVCEITNSGAGVSIAVHAAWDALRSGVLANLNTANGAKNLFVGIIMEVDGAGTMTRGLYTATRIYS